MSLPNDTLVIEVDLADWIDLMKQRGQEKNKRVNWNFKVPHIAELQNESGSSSIKCMGLRLEQGCLSLPGSSSSAASVGVPSQCVSEELYKSVGIG